MSVMPVQEYNRWMIIEQEEPFGEYGEWLRTGMVIASLANIHRGKDQAMFMPLDFMPMTFKPEVKKQSSKDIKQIFLAIMEYQNKLVEQKGGGTSGA